MGSWKGSRLTGILGEPLSATRRRASCAAPTWFVGLAALLSSCSTMPSPNDAMEDHGAPPLHSIVFFVHGDANYTYHDARGKVRRADEVLVAEARNIAADNPQAEVHIFHQIERRHFLFVFPRRDGRSYHYRNGHLVGKTSYWRDEGPSRLAPEIRILAERAGPDPVAGTRTLLYFGHELPEFHGAGYDAS